MDSEMENSANMEGQESDITAQPSKSPISSYAQDNSADIQKEESVCEFNLGAPPVCPLAQTLDILSENSTEIKNEPMEIVENICATAEQTMSSETNAENSPETLQNESTETIPNEEIEVMLETSEDLSATEIKNELTDVVEVVPENVNATENQNESNETEAETFVNNSTETVPETSPNNENEVLRETSENLSTIQQDSNQNVRVKSEPCSMEIDYGMPIAKTPMHTSSAESFEPNMDGNRNVNTSYSSLDKFPSKSALDEYLDGMVTPIAPPIPRIRVKAELALLKPPSPKTTPQSNDIDNDTESMETEMCPPPPPPTFSSNTISDNVADGIATPRISLASINRLRVKSELSLLPPNQEHTLQTASDDCFNRNFDTNTGEKEPGEVSPSLTDAASDDEQIPSDYFDDLLIDKLKEKIDQAQNNDLEIKYSDRLKELERLKNELKRVQDKKERKIRKKQKKSKKKSRKRSRSRSISPHSKARERRGGDHSPTQYNYDRHKRNRLSPIHEQRASTSNYASRHKPEEKVLEITTGYMDIKLEHPANEFESFSREPLTVIEKEVEEVLTPAQRKDRAIKRASALLTYLQNKSEENSSVLSEFPFVSTIRKLPYSLSYVQQRIYENRSPLHTVNNVQYKFNSENTRFNMEEWGLAPLPPNAAMLAKLVGCDAQFIHDKLKTMKLPAKLRKIKQEPNTEAENEEEGEELVETSSSLFSNAMTQTDDIGELGEQSKPEVYEIGVQAQSEVYSIGCQTVESRSPTKDRNKTNEDLPIMNLMEELNENQLMAIHSFAELIKEPNPSTSAMGMYKIQMRIMEIYKISQIPSTLETGTQPPIVNNYATTKPRPREQSQLCIQSVKGADGRQYSVNDPRNKPAPYSQRLAYDEAAAAALRYNDRYAQPQHSAVRPSTSRGYSQTYFNTTNEPDGRYNTSPSSRLHPHVAHHTQSPTSTVKHYGRGGLRR